MTTGSLGVDESHRPRTDLRIESRSNHPEKPVISIVVPVYRSESTIDELCRRVSATLNQLNLSHEVILVEDCGGDHTWPVCKGLAEADQHIKAIRLRRNYGQHNALLCGIRAASGDIVVTIDDDLQNPPEEIPRLLDQLNRGYDVVYGTPTQMETTRVRRWAGSFTKRSIRQLGGFDAASEASSFRAFRRELADSFDAFRYPHANIDVLLSWGTENFTSVPVRHDARTHGQSGYSTFKLIRHAINMITGFSASPLKVASLAGFGAGIFGFLLMLYVAGSFFLFGQQVPGFAFLASSVALFSGVQLFCIGIIGEYLGRLYFGSMGKPDYVVAEQAFPPARPIEDPRF